MSERKEEMLRAACNLLKLLDEKYPSLNLLDERVRYRGESLEGFVLVSDIEGEL